MKLIPAQHVTPFVRGNKNDHNDAFDIAEASQRAHIRFVPVKSEHQQEISCLHRIRGLLSEFGVVFPCGQAALIVGLGSVIDNAQYSLLLPHMMTDILDEYKVIRLRLKHIEQQLRECVDSSESGQILLSIPGIGIINASAFLAAIDKGQAFNTPKEFAVWLGLTPKQHASGNMSKMGGITKRGDRYLRKQLVHGARALVSRAAKSNNPLSVWAMKLRVSKPLIKWRWPLPIALLGLCGYCYLVRSIIKRCRIHKLTHNMTQFTLSRFNSNPSETKAQSLCECCGRLDSG